VTLTPARIKKYRDIASLFIRYGGLDVLRHPSFHPALHLGFDDAPPEPGSGDPSGLADDLEALGPTFIKLGQLLSTRADLLPQEYLDALGRLQDHVAPFPIKEVRRIIADELGKPISKIFKTFEAEPLAAASLAQVHRATLPDRRRVAVKVQRPDIRDQINDDLEVLQVIAEFLDKHTELGRKYEFQRMLDEFRRTILSELDFRQEAQNMAVIGANLRDYASLFVPMPIDTHTTGRVLVMEYVRGKKITEVGPDDELDGPDLAEQMFRAYLQQILVDGIFHADPHPGNVMLTPDGRLALLDLGMVGRVSPPLQEDMLKVMLATSEGEAGEAADILIKLSEARESFDESTFRREIAGLLMRYRDASLKEIPVGRVMLEITRIAVECGLRVVPELTMLAKTLLNLDQVGRVLDPEFDPNQALRRNASGLIQRRLLRGLSPANFFTSALETREFVQELPARANRILDALSRNDLRLRVEMIDEGAVIDGLQKVANRITLGLVLAALIVGAAMLMRIETSFKILGYPGLAILFFFAAAGGGVWLAFTILSSDRTPGPRLPSKPIS